jgi:hypothetical protein
LLDPKAIRDPVARAATFNGRKLVSRKFEEYEYGSTNARVAVFSKKDESQVVLARIALVPHVNLQLAFSIILRI